MAAIVVPPPPPPPPVLAPISSDLLENPGFRRKQSEKIKKDFKKHFPGKLLNLLLPCFGLSVLYLATPDPARRPGIAPPCSAQSTFSFMVNANCTVVERRFNSHRKTRCLPSPFLSIGMMNLCIRHSKHDCQWPVLSKGSSVRDRKQTGQTGRHRNRGRYVLIGSSI